MRPSRFDHLTALRRQGADRDYSDGGEVEHAVRQFLADTDNWLLRSRIAFALGVSLSRVDTVLWRLRRKGQVQMYVDERGHVLWRGAQTSEPPPR